MIAAVERRAMHLMVYPRGRFSLTLPLPELRLHGNFARCRADVDERLARAHGNDRLSLEET